MSSTSSRGALLFAALCLFGALSPISASADFHHVADIDNPSEMPADGSPYDAFGASVAIVGDLMVSGSPYDQVGAIEGQGSVYLFQRQGMQWLRTERLVAPIGTTSRGFGTVVAMSSDTIAIAATRGANSALVTDSSASAPPAVFVFGRSGPNWVLHATLRPLNPVAEPRFGSALGISGDDLFVTSPGVGGSTGRAYVFRRVSGAWPTVASGTLASGTVGETSFGASLAVSGDRMVVGAPESTGIATQRGAVYLYERSAGQWVPQGTIDVTNSSGLSETRDFGRAVAIDDDNVLVGAPESIANGTAQGAVFAFQVTGATWSQNGAPLRRPSAMPGESVRYGSAVAVSGQRALVGAYESNDLSWRGAVYALMRGSEWENDGAWMPDTGTDQEAFGYAIAMNDTRAVVGAPLADSFLATPAIGAVYIYIAEPTMQNGSAIWRREVMLRLPDGAARDQFGYRVVVDGDTMLVAAPLQERGLQDVAGGVRVYLRRNGHWVFDSVLPGPSNATLGDWFGWSIALKGDIAVVGAMHVDVNAPDDGAVYVYRRTESVWSLDAILTSPDGGHAYDNFGSAVTIDVQSQHRILVGAWRGDVAQSQDCGAAYLFEYNGVFWMPRAMLYPDVRQDLSLFGASLALTGNRAFVGAPQQDVGGAVDAGALHVFDASDGNWRSRAMISVPSVPSSGDNFAAALSVQQRGVSDTLMIGAPGAIVGNRHGGGVFRATWSGLQSGNYLVTALPTPPTVRDGDRLGAAIAIHDEHVLVGAPFSDIAPAEHLIRGGVFERPDTGAAYFYPNGDAELAQRLHAPGLEFDGRFGTSVAIGPMVGPDPLEVMIGMPGVGELANRVVGNFGRVALFDTEHLLLDSFEDR